MNHYLFLFAVCGVSTLVGIFLFFRALHPPRRGETPYCRKCGYDLTGKDLNADSSLCSECGTSVGKPGTIVRGERHRRPKLAVVGLALFLLGMTPVGFFAADSFNYIDWFKYKPVFMLVSDLQTRNALRAGQELNDRYTDGKLSASEINSWAEKLLALQAQTPKPLGLSDSMDHLAALCVDQRLSPVQKNRFFSQTILLPKLEIRPRAVVGDKVPFQFENEDRVPQNHRLTFGYKEDCVKIDDQLVQSSRWDNFRSYTMGSPPTPFGQFTCNKPGRHKVQAEWTIGIFLPGKSYEKDTPDWVNKYTMTGEFEALAEEPKDMIKLTRSQEMEDWAVKNITIYGLKLEPSENNKDLPTLELNVEAMSPPPISAAFDVVVEANDIYTLVGSAAIFSNNRGGYCTNLWCKNLPPDIDPHQMSILLIRSPDAAKKTTDIFEIWDGNLRFPPATISKLLNASQFGPSKNIKPILDDSCYDILCTPKILPPGGKFNENIRVTLERPLLGGKYPIRYTLDGSDPQPDSPEYKIPILISNDKTVKARSFMPHGPIGNAAEASYRIVDETPPTVKGILADTSKPNIRILFSELLDKSSAEDTTHYTLPDDNRVKSAALQSDGCTVELTLAVPVSVTMNRVTIQDVKDQSPAGNLLEEGSHPVFVLHPPVVSLDKPSPNTEGAASKELTLESKTLTSAKSPWTINLWLWVDKQPNDLTVIAGFGSCKDETGTQRYLAQFPHGLHFWGSNVDVAGNAKLDEGKWQMLTAAFDAKTLRIFKDGHETASETISLEDAEPVAKIGPPPPWAGRGQLAGKVAGFAIWDQALPQEAIEIMYLIGAPN